MLTKIINKFRKTIEFRIFLYDFKEDSVRIRGIFNKFFQESKIKGNFIIFDSSEVKVFNPKNKDITTHIVIQCNDKKARDSLVDIISKDSRFAECKIDCLFSDCITI